MIFLMITHMCGMVDHIATQLSLTTIIPIGHGYKNDSKIAADVALSI
jgi:hypothetical protein